MAAETLIQVTSVKACFWLANLQSEILYSKPNNEYKIKID